MLKDWKCGPSLGLNFWPMKASVECSSLICIERSGDLSWLTFVLSIAYHSGYFEESFGGGLPQCLELLVLGGIGGPQGKEGDQLIQCCDTLFSGSE